MFFTLCLHSLSWEEKILIFGFFLFPKKKKKMLWVFILFSRPPRETKSFQAAITNTHSLNLAISPFFFRLLLSKREVYKRARGPTRKKKNQKNELFA
jgi:hypothetical protein